MTNLEEFRALSIEELLQLLTAHKNIRAVSKVLNNGNVHALISRELSIRIRSGEIPWVISSANRCSYTPDVIKVAFNTAECWSDIYRFLDLSISDHNKKAIIRFADKNNIDVPKFSKKQITDTFQRGKKIWNISSIFCENSKYSRTSLRHAVIRFDILPNYQCSECGIKTIWNKKDLTLDLDHINGISNDNRETNLRWLCPNCHSQTITFKGKNTKSTN